LKSGISGADSESAGRVDAFTMSMGGYASIEQSDTWFLEGAVQASRHDIDAAFSDGAKSSGRIWGHSASVEAGLRVGITGAFYVEPQAQVLWMHNAECSMSTPAGAVTLHDTQLFVCRAGLNGQFEPEGLSFSPFFELNAERGFGGVSQVTYADTGRSWQVDADRFHVGAALGISSRHPKKSGMEYSVKTGIMVGMNGYGTREYQLTVGLRKSW
jgi:outer membrane autotransporter protein